MVKTPPARPSFLQARGRANEPAPTTALAMLALQEVASEFSGMPSRCLPSSAIRCSPAYPPRAYLHPSASRKSKVWSTEGGSCPSSPLHTASISSRSNSRGSTYSREVRRPRGQMIDIAQRARATCTDPLGTRAMQHRAKKDSPRQQLPHARVLGRRRSSRRPAYPPKIPKSPSPPAAALPLDQRTPDHHPAPPAGCIRGRRDAAESY